jgi:hypothetical protein
MSHDLYNSHHELNRPYNPWERFTLRDENKHRVDSELRFRLGRAPFQLPIPSPTSTVQPLPTRATAEVIELFLTFDSHHLYDDIPRQRQLLRDFLTAVTLSLPATSSPRQTDTYIADVKRCNSIHDIALIDDRNYHDGCARKIGRVCTECHIVSKKVSIPDLCSRLEDEVSHTGRESRIDLER